MRLAHRILICSLAWLSSPALAHPPGVADEDQAIAHEVEALREELKRAIERKDVHALRAIYADTFTHTHGSGRVDGKDTRIVSALAGDPVIETAPVEELNYRVFANGTIIVTGKSPILNKSENKSHDFRWMAVYVKAGERWQLVASQATRLP
jgi:ketosteroid isomerase-like protein